MEIINGDILDITDGIICQQVNCTGGYGAGLSGKISKKYPQVEKAYRNLFKSTPRSSLFGICQPVRINDDLIIVNIFAEWDYANAYEQGIVSTDMDKLVSGVKRVCEKYAGRKIYVPHRIGCGLAGGDWNEFSRRCAELPIVVVRPPWAK